PQNREHGLENPNGAHAGDLPNLTVDAFGRGVMQAATNRVTLGIGPTSLFDADGSAVVIHAGADDQVTNPTGNSGGRIACGVIQPIP
ncbi:MAG: superoxide dismutase family protein, partial [Armatimonadetes bacterium]|nr:superoxide dismutase family protein [Armatimonadota bacterium]